MRLTSLALLIGGLVLSSFCAAYEYEIGTGKGDITGPASGLQMFGFVREGQNTEGIHTRLWARAFVIAEPAGKNRLAFVVADLGSVPHDVQLAVLRKLGERYGKTYNRANTIISATHTHAGPGGYWPVVEAGPLTGAFYRAHFEAIVDGIVSALVEAHESLEPGDIYLNRGEVENAGANRSETAYLNNPEEERARYDSNTDKQMVLLKMVTADGVVGILNWFAVHPTSMTYYNQLISGDNKGRAEQLFESRASGEAYADDFIAAFANSNCGDVTPNLNLDNTGPGADDFESTHIIAERQFDVALELARTAARKLKGPIQSVQAYVDFSDLKVSDEYTHAGPQCTCASAYGYAFAAGSTEDGGGHPLFREGMTQRIPAIDEAIKKDLGALPSDEIRACHEPKPLLLAPGDMDPPAQSQIIPLGLARVGSLVLVAVPGEITTMAGRRLRETVQQVAGDNAEVVIAAYSNHYTGYVTTYEEYQTQQYEGGHTIFGPWELAGMQQEFARLSQSLSAGKIPEPGPNPRDFLAVAQDAGLDGGADQLPDGKTFGLVIQDAESRYEAGQTVEAAFWSANPNNGFEKGFPYLEVQRKTDGGWETVATDDAWATRYKWEPVAEQPGASRALLRWDIPANVPAGEYRLLHRGMARSEDGSLKPFEGLSRAFSVGATEQ